MKCTGKFRKLSEMISNLVVEATLPVDKMNKSLLLPLDKLYMSKLYMFIYVSLFNLYNDSIE